LFALHVLVTGRWAELRWDVPFAAVMFVVFLPFYGLGWLGGGDVKLLAVAFLWTGLSGALPFAIFLALFCGVHGLAAKFDWVKSQDTASGRRRIPYAPSVAGALICTFMLRSLQLA
jgi:prepilin peptidase CpaA